MTNPFNPDAGDTPAPSDPVGIDVARRAAALVWRAVPYLRMRYGERGRRFALSDGGWLVTLAGLPPAVRRGQIEWLARLLAPRGMPSWLCELQLAATARAGRRLAWPGAEALAHEARELAERRRARLSDAVFARADRLFVEVARGAPARLARGTGRLVASAHVDVALELCPSPLPLLDWLRDPARFDAEWRGAVDRTGELVGEELRRA
jgi:hypothetical protein